MHLQNYFSGTQKKSYGRRTLAAFEILPAHPAIRRLRCIDLGCEVDHRSVKFHCDAKRVAIRDCLAQRRDASLHRPSLMKRGGVWLGQGESKKQKLQSATHCQAFRKSIVSFEPFHGLFRRDHTMEQALFGFNTGKYATEGEELLKSRVGLLVLRQETNELPNPKDYGTGRPP